MKKIVLSAIFLTLLVVSIRGGYFIYQLFGQKYQGDEQLFEVYDGEGFSKVNYRLYTSSLISSASAFYHYARLKGVITKLRAGLYKIPTGATTAEVLSILTEGNPILISVTIPEGKNIYEIAEILSQKEIISKDEFLNLAISESFTQSLGIPSDRVEGYLYPDTYRFSPHALPEQIIKHLVNEFHKHLGTLDLSNSSFTLHQLITLASIVEKETGASFERPAIAGVFLNRLQKNIRLQSDPTTIYGIYENYKGNLRKRDLQEKTAYNTYKINGLPPGPICNPGLSAIEAVLFPQQHNYIYFVSKNDGTHVFTEKYEDHVKAVNYFQKNRGQRAGKSWRNLKATPFPQPN